MSKTNVYLFLGITLILLFSNMVSAQEYIPPPDSIWIEEANDSYIKIGWTHPQPGEHYYKVYYGESNYGDYIIWIPADTSAVILHYTDDSVVQHQLYGYKVTASTGGIFESEFSDTVYAFADDDSLPPTFSNFYPDYGADGSPFHIGCDITDPSGVDPNSVYLVWSLNPDYSDSTEISMQPIGGDTYQTVTPIPTLPINTVVYYKIFASDNDFDLNNPDDRSTGWVEKTLTVLDDDTSIPNFTFTDNIVTDAQDSFHVHCYISDPSGVNPSSVYLKYATNPDFSDSLNSPMMPDSVDINGNGRYITQNSFNTIGYYYGNFYYHVFAADADMDLGNPDDVSAGYNENPQSVFFVDDDEDEPTFNYNEFTTLAYETVPFRIEISAYDISGIYTGTDEFAPYIVWDDDGDIAGGDTLLLEYKSGTFENKTLQTDSTITINTMIGPNLVYKAYVWDADFDFGDPDDRTLAESNIVNITMADDDTLPPILINTTPPQEDDGVNIHFHCTAIDSSGIASVQVIWDEDGDLFNGGERDSFLTNTSGNDYEVTFNETFPPGTQIAYYFIAIDADFDHPNDQLQTQSPIDTILIIDDDTEPPIITNISPIQGYDGDPIQFSCDIFDDSGVDSAYVIWDDDGSLSDGGEGKEYLYHISGNHFETNSIGNYPPGDSSIVYQIYAFDGDTDHPNDQLSSVSDIYSVTIVDDDTIPPYLYNHHPTELNDGIGNGTGVEYFRIDVIDSSGVDTVYVHWGYGSLTTYFPMTLMPGTEHTYESQGFAAYPNTNVMFQFFAVDADNDFPGDSLQNQTQIFDLYVTDDDTIGPDFSRFRPLTTIDSDSFFVSCRITDDQNEIYDDSTGSEGQGIYLLWDDDGSIIDQTYEQEITMSLKPGETDIYITDVKIPPQSIAMESLFVYEIYAYDNDHDIGLDSDRKKGRSGQQYLDAIIDDDTTPPEFTNITIDKNYIADTTAFSVSCVITDESGIYDDDTGPEGQGVHLIYDTDGNLNNGYADFVKMSRVDSSDTFRTDVPIPPQIPTNNFVFRIFAYDNDFDGYEPYPIDRELGQSPIQSIVIHDDDIDPPQFTYFSPDSISDGENIDIYSVITDSISEVDESTVFLHWYNTTTSDSVLMIRIADTDTFVAYNIPSQLTGTPFSYYIKAYDADNDWDGDQALGVSVTRSIVIYDDDTTPPEFSELIPQAPFYDDELLVFGATIEDESGIFDGSGTQGTWVAWEQDSISFTTGLNLIPGSQNQYATAVLGKKTAGTEIGYRIYAYDNDFDNQDPGDRTLGISDSVYIVVEDDDPDPPVIGETSPLQTPETQPFHIICSSITDYSGIDTVKLYWDNDLTPEDGDLIYMEPTGNGDEYITETMIPAHLVGNDITYIIIASDLDDDHPNDALTATSETRIVTIIDDDITPPIITNIYSEPEFIIEGNPFHMYCTITDESGVDQNNLYMEYGEDETIDLISIGNDEYRTNALIPPQILGDFPFTIYAIDLDMDRPNDQSDTTHPASFVIADDDTLPPNITNIYSEPQNPLDSENFHVFCTVTDDQEVDTNSVYLEYGANNTISMHFIGNDQFQTETHVPSQPIGIFEFSIHAADTDSANNEIPNSTTVLSQLSITDDDTTPPQVSNVYSVPSELNDAQEFMVYCTITDESGVDPDSTKMLFGEMTIPMVPDTTANVFKTAYLVPPQPHGTFEFQIYAVDADTDHPQDQTAVYHDTSIEIEDNDTQSPIISDIYSQPLQIKDSDNFFIFCTITDDSEVDTGTVYVEYGEEEKVDMKLISDNLYRTKTLLPTQVVGNFPFAIYAADTDTLHGEAPNDTILHHAFSIADDDTLPPEFIEITTSPSPALDNGTFDVICLLGDESGISSDSILLQWDDDGELYNDFQIIPMSPVSKSRSKKSEEDSKSKNLQRGKTISGKGVWEEMEFITDESIPSYPFGTEIVLRVTAYDNDFDNAIEADKTYGKSEIVSIIVEDDDTLPPNFDNFVTDPETIDDLTPFHISCDITDPSGIYEPSVHLLWSITNNFTNPHTIEMSNIGGDTYRTDQMIPKQDPESFVYYKVIAFDNDFDNNFAEDRTEGVSSVQIIEIGDDDVAPPTFDKFSPSEIQDTEYFQIICEISDESGIYDDNTGSEGQGVYLLWDYDGEVEIDHAGEVMMDPLVTRGISKNTPRGRESVMFVSEIIPPQPSGKTFYYRVYAHDNDFDNANVNDRMLGISELQHVNILDDDNEPPTFSNFDPIEIPVNREFYFRCDIEDSTGIYVESGKIYDPADPQIPFTVTLIWDNDGELDVTWNIMEMEPVESDTSSRVLRTFQTIEAIPAQEVGAPFVYVVYACDTDTDYGNIGDISFGNSGTPRQIEIHPVDKLGSAYVYPNPAPTKEYPEEIHFRYYVEEGVTEVYIQVFDVLGDLIWEAEERNLNEKYYNETLWDISDIASGLYVFRIETKSPSGSHEVVKKLAIAK